MMDAVVIVAVIVIAIVDIAIVVIDIGMAVGMMCNCGGDFNCHRVRLEFCFQDGRIK